MSENKKLNPLVTDLIEEKLKNIDWYLENNLKHLEVAQAEVNLTKEKISELRQEKLTLSNILKTGNATLTENLFNESPKEFKVRE